MRWPRRARAARPHRSRRRRVSRRPPARIPRRDRRGRSSHVPARPAASSRSSLLSRFPSITMSNPASVNGTECSSVLNVFNGTECLNGTEDEHGLRRDLGSLDEMEDTIVVSGGGTGIGAAVVRRLVANGRHVTVVGRRQEPLSAIAFEFGSSVSTIAADVSTPEGASAVGASLAQCSGLVAAAGGNSPRPGGAGELEQVVQDWQASFQSNVLTRVLLV